VFYRFVPERHRMLSQLVLMAAHVALSLPSPYFAFILGALAFELSRARLELPKWLPVCALLVGLLMAFPADGFVWRWRGGSLPPALRPGESSGIVGAVAAFLVIFAIMHSRAIARPLEMKWPIFLGRVSFPLYLLHVPILYTVIALLVRSAEFYSRLSMLFVFTVFLTFSLIVAWHFEKRIDAPLVDALGRLKRTLRARRLPEVRAGHVT
jgi:peptidoglycan/LPS O-acetylase OafA/YrhL